MTTMKSYYSTYITLRSLCAGMLFCGVTIAASASSDSGNASLSALEIKVDGHNIVDGFSSETAVYNVEADASLPTLAAFSAAPVASDAIVDISVNGSTLTNHSVAQLVKGDNLVSFKVVSGDATKTYTVKITPASNERTMYFKGDWGETPYAYVYSASSSTTEHAGAWPGTAMTEAANGWYSYVLPEAADQNARVIFNTGNDGNNRYPADRQPGIQLNFPGKEGWYLLSDKKWYSENPEGPQKPSISVSPAGGRVKGTGFITISFSNDPTSVSGSFNGRELSLSTTSATRLNVSDYLNDGESATLSVSASNQEGEATFSATYNRDDSQPVTTLTGDHRELSIYQVMVGSFQHGEGGASGYTDMWGPEGHRKNGNLRGIINSLDYIKELGMNALWMTPVFDSTNGQGGEKLQATGYFCTNYFKIDPKFGTEEEFDELVAEAHSRGIYVILDGVFGHHGGVTAPSPEGRYIDTMAGTANVRGTDAGNIAYPGSLEYFKEVIRYWMNRGVDGWRLDQCYQVYQGGHNYWYDLRLEVEAVCQERKNRGEEWGTLGFMVGEDWTSAGGITVTQQDGLKSVMDFDGKDNLVGLSAGVGSVGWYLSTDAAGRGYRDAGVNPTIFLSNHDTARVGDFVDINSDVEGLMTRHAAVACYSGPTCTYYGDEIGDKRGNGNPDNWARTSGRLDGFNANEQRLHDYVAKVFNARAENPALWRGTVSRDQIANDLEVITKTDAETGNTVVVIFSQKDQSVSIGGTGEDLINGGTVSGSVNVSAWVPAFIRMQ